MITDYCGPSFAKESLFRLGLTDNEAISGRIRPRRRDRKGTAASRAEGERIQATREREPPFRMACNVPKQGQTRTPAK